jgi:hemerythrin
MAYMQWAPELELGIPVIDDQNKRIVDYINQLDRARLNGSRDDTEHVLEGLLDYTIRQFTLEEELQQKAGYPFLKAHQRVHEIFMKRIATLRARFQQGENVTGELLSMLTGWLSNHIQGDDREYAESVRKITGSVDPETASWLSSTLKKLFG